MAAEMRSDSTKAHDGATSRLVWRAVGRRKATCDLGCEHELETWVSKRVTETGTYVMDNGYEKRTMGVYTDRQGTRYFARIEIDFHASTYFVVQREQGRPWIHWQSRPHSVGDRIAVDILGRKL